MIIEQIQNCNYIKYTAQTQRDITDFFSVIAKSILVLWYIYPNTLFGFPEFIHSRRISVFIALIYLLITHRRIYIVKKSKTYHILSKMLILQVVFLIYSLFTLFLNGWGDGRSIFNIIVDFILYSLLTVYIFDAIFDNVDDLMRVLLIVSLLQSFIIVACLASNSMASFIDVTFNQNSYWNYPIRRAEGYAGGIACLTSTGSLQLSLGIISCLYYFIQHRHKRSRLVYLICFLFIAFASTAVSRTGLIIASFAIFFIIITLRKNNIINLIKFVLVAFLALLTLYFIISATGLIENLPSIFKRLMYLFRTGLYGGYFKYYFHGDNTYIPKLSIDTLIGTGIVSGMSGNGVYVNVDGGYLRLYVAFGLPLAILFYILIFKYMVQALRVSKEKNLRFIAGFMIVLIFIIGEVKEFFIYSEYMIMVYFLMLRLGEKQERIE